MKGLNNKIQNMKKALLYLIFASLLNFANAQVTEIANVTTPGTLNTVAKSYLSIVTNLTIIGNIDARDFKTMRDSMPVLTVLNLSSATIAAYSGTAGTQDANKDSYAENTMPQYAFYNQQTYEGKTTLTSLTFSNNFTSIGECAFSFCSGLKGSLTIPSSVTYIGDKAFQECTGLTGSLTIPTSVTYIGWLSYSYCSGFTGTLTIPSSVSYISEEAFYGCSGLTGMLTIPSTVTYIGEGAFSACSGFSGFIVNPSNPYYSSINGVIFNKNKTILVEYPGGVTGSYSIPSFVDSITDDAFEECTGLTGSLTIPSSVTFIGYHAFFDCSGITGSLTFPSSVTYIGEDAFDDCPGLTSIFALNPVPLTGNNMGSDVFEYDNSIINLYVPCGSVNAYQATPQWNSFNILVNDRFVIISVSADTVASGSSVTFKADTSCISESALLQWQVNGKNEGTGKGIFNYIPVNSDTVTCNVTLNDTTTTSNAIVMNVLSLSVSKDTLNIDATANSQRIFSIYSNAAWTLTTSKTLTWLTPSSTSGSDTTLITLTATANTSSKQRIDTVIVSTNGVKSVNVIVTQEAGPSTGIIDLTINNVTLYPNPVTDYLSVSIPNPPSQTSITIYNLNGKEVYSSNVTSSITDINMSGYPSGVYLIKIISPDNGIITRKVIKQ